MIRLQILYIVDFCLENIVHRRMEILCKFGRVLLIFESLIMQVYQFKTFMKIKMLHCMISVTVSVQLVKKIKLIKGVG